MSVRSAYYIITLYFTHIINTKRMSLFLIFIHLFYKCSTKISQIINANSKEERTSDIREKRKKISEIVCGSWNTK